MKTTILVFPILFCSIVEQNRTEILFTMPLLSRNCAPQSVLSLLYSILHIFLFFLLFWPLLFFSLLPYPIPFYSLKISTKLELAPVLRTKLTVVYIVFCLLFLRPENFLGPSCGPSLGLLLAENLSLRLLDLSSQCFFFLLDLSSQCFFLSLFGSIQ